MSHVLLFENHLRRLQFVTCLRWYHCVYSIVVSEWMFELAPQLHAAKHGELQL